MEGRCFGLNQNFNHTFNLASVFVCCHGICCLFCGIIGFALGVISQKMDVPLILNLVHRIIHRLDLFDSVAHSFSLVRESKATKVPLTQQDRCDPEVESTTSSFSDAIIKESKSTLIRQGSKFASSIRKLSGLSGLPHGLIEAQGKQLQIISMDRAMRQMLGAKEKKIGA